MELGFTEETIFWGLGLRVEGLGFGVCSQFSVISDASDFMVESYLRIFRVQGPGVRTISRP